jgi:hypothetical protein
MTILTLSYGNGTSIKNDTTLDYNYPTPFVSKNIVITSNLDLEIDVA